MPDYFKALTHDYRPPVQGGDPIWDGVTLPYVLPTVKLDVGRNDCGAGWNCADSLAGVLRIAGLWPDGRPSMAVTVGPSADMVRRGEKIRSSGLTITGRIPESEIGKAIRVLSDSFGGHADRMCESQVAWRDALARPRHNVRDVRRGLRAALRARGVDGWELQRYPDNDDVRAARDARAVRDAWDAWDALTLEYAALNGWTDHDPLLLTTGLRDAYRAGLGIAIPVADRVLGWAMDGGSDA